jgi:hypothetical protein
MSGRRGGIPGPESRTGLVRPPAMTEAEFERRQAAGMLTGAEDPAATPAPVVASEPEPGGRASTASRRRGGRTVKPKRVQRMFAIEEELDKKLWLYAIHVGKDRSEVINDLLRPIVASMVLYDSRDRRAARAAEPSPEGEGGPPTTPGDNTTGSV